METVRIEFDPSVYSEKAVKAAVKDYAASADVKMEKSGGAIVVEIRNYPEEYEGTVLEEFCNYVLWKTRN